MKIRSNILTFGFMFAVVCLVGCKRKSEPAKAEGKPAEPNIVQPVKVDSRAVEPKQIVATVNGVAISKSDYETRIEQQIGKVQRQMPASFFEQYKAEVRKKVLDEMIVNIFLVKIQ
ncbi:MAG: SurA N-terminal domain-containing protein [Sedimentisphaerales bacterium]|nr:SurA N-terminal domain-containing protein [Sedimentisphaerales bacterium]